MQIRQQRGERVNLERFVTQASKHSKMEASEEATVLGLWRSARHYAANSTIAPEDGIRLITRGWAGWLRYDNDGRQLIFLFLLPGDFVIPGLFELGCCDLICLTPLHTVDANRLASGGSAPTSAAMIAHSGRDYRLLLLDHLTRLTIGSTIRSVAHLLSEFHARTLRAGTCEGGRFSMPIGQRVLARSLGRSSVQINKVIGKLQDAELLRVGNGWMEILKPEALRALAGISHSVLSPARPFAGIERQGEA